ncbi:hypothetical protein TVAG_032680 [Trichomonas vaginalis G3]|uniref:Uncharacterized protein n=1 Tax=Trichomonas vaginalis (strain ATCC PRA-98 / G3) TaxID=412133 RepID=A2FMI3_TRIV3|nr:hypothetical protein TVAGG3_0054340 [Trichomonas vaginalis G3]EAX93882.1 hypothetical protein TVAG_032680 [Trichomonas vaginalis G3]KAI5541528.1 hypothetical protein TVAGG3_0054340 [Trichomonas vaginalis G3]|eukprot:XP_001306812.1 hypothetical protein [Trichomonas vaginalis G3]
MKKSGKKTSSVNDSQRGVMDRLEGMVGRSMAKKGIYSTTSPYSKQPTDTEALLDMLDKRVGKLLIKSSEIESKLDAIEGIQRKTYNPRPVTKTSGSKKQSEVSVTSETSKKSTKQSKIQLKPRFRSTDSSSEKSHADFDFQALFDLVQNLATEVHEMRKEQTQMHDQINMIQDALFRSAEEEENVE